MANEVKIISPMERLYIPERPEIPTEELRKMLNEDPFSMKPYFVHDCDECIYLGSYNIEGDKRDFYTCGKQGYWTYIARHGSKGSEYLSYPSFVIKDCLIPDVAHMILHNEYMIREGSRHSCKRYKFFVYVVNGGINVVPGMLVSQRYLHVFHHAHSFVMTKFVFSKIDEVILFEVIRDLEGILSTWNEDPQSPFFK